MSGVIAVSFLFTFSVPQASVDGSLSSRTTVRLASKEQIPGNGTTGSQRMNQVESCVCCQRGCEGHSDTNSPQAFTGFSLLYRLCPSAAGWDGLSARKLPQGGSASPGEKMLTCTHHWHSKYLHPYFDLPLPHPVCLHLDIFVSLSLNYDLTPETWANTPSITRGCLAGQSVPRYGILFTLQPHSIVLTRAIAMATVLFWPLSMGGKVPHA